MDENVQKRVSIEKVFVSGSIRWGKPMHLFIMRRILKSNISRRTKVKALRQLSLLARLLLPATSAFVDLLLVHLFSVFVIYIDSQLSANSIDKKQLQNLWNKCYSKVCFFRCSLLRFACSRIVSVCVDGHARGEAQMRRLQIIYCNSTFQTIHFRCAFCSPVYHLLHHNFILFPDKIRIQANILTREMLAKWEIHLDGIFTDKTAATTNCTSFVNKIHSFQWKCLWQN